MTASAFEHDACPIKANLGPEGKRLASDLEIIPEILERWSPRSFDATAMPAGDLRSILEAAGLAASAFNHQPWRFLVSHNGDEHWEKFVSLLVPLNQQWAKNASVLVFLISDTLIEISGSSMTSRTHSFDAGAAWAHLALQATRLGYHCHAMAGVDFERARTELSVPDQFHIEAAIAIGRKAAAEHLPEPLQEREMRSTRRSVEEMAFLGPYGVRTGADRENCGLAAGG